MPAACPAAPSRPYAPMVMAAGTLKRIHVNQHIIRTNIKDKTDTPTCTVQWKGKSYVGRDVLVKGASQVMQRMHKPLSCGARIWIETRAEVEIL
jgi:hypothetical protein